MNKVILDPTTLTALGNLDHFAELCDPSGRTLGYFTPAIDRTLYDEVDFSMDEEELRRREQEPTFTTAEVLDHLEKLSPAGEPLMFSVRWASSAVDELARFWTDADSAERQSISRATREIDSILRIDPESAGESRAELRRILLAPPLGVMFEVEPLDRTVRVVKILRFRRRAGGA